MSLTTKLFGTYSERQIKKINKTVNIIESLAPKYAAMSDEELSNVTNILKDRLANGETLDDILPDAFAAVREADDRVLGKRPFRVQLIGGIILHQGRIAEMKTGEGKTLVATMPAYLNALSGNGVHIVTVNDYLATRDSEEMGRVYGFMGLKTGLIVHGLSSTEKQEAYNADITYGTNNEFGFDYLRDNMAIYKSRMLQRGHNFAIVDEVDSILIDEARIPLIISGEGEDAADEMYAKVDKFVRSLKKLVVKEVDNKEAQDNLDADYIVDEKANTAVLTPGGAKKAEEYFGVENYSDPENSSLVHYVNQGIKAYGIMHRDIDYVVNENGVVLVDAFTGRLTPGRRYSDGLHQAIEAKERVKVEKEDKTLASITFQNYFRMYRKLSGMTGTAMTEDNEFREIYTLDVVEVPTNKPMIRLDRDDVVYKSVKSKYRAVIEQIKECHEKGQPVLVGTVSIDKSEELSKLLKLEKIPHTVLNAKYHAKEAEIIAQAGKYGAVTISTNMAGRGTDIMLGGNPEFMAKNEMRRLGFEEGLIAQSTGSKVTENEELNRARATFKELYEKYKEEIAPEAEKVKEAGGLFVLGTERHESRRIDNQLRGRSGRQGDPGESRFFLSLEDDLLRLFGGERIIGLFDAVKIDENVPIEAKILSGTIESSQKKIEAQNFKRRKYVLSYDDVMNQQRSLIYKQRREVLDGEDVSEKIFNMIRSTVSANVARFTSAEDKNEWSLSALKNEYMGILCTSDDFNYSEDELKKLEREDIEDLLIGRAEKLYHEKEELFGKDISGNYRFREVERSVLLRNVDYCWMEHMVAMNDLKGSISLHSYAQRDPVVEYRMQGADMFDEMISEIRERTARMIMGIQLKTGSEQRVEVARATGAGFENLEKQAKKNVAAAQNVGGPARREPVRKGTQVGRNDPCPCGSGKKYKKCCGANNSVGDEN